MRNPDFSNWNHVHMKYCSSDSWTGDNVQTLPEGPIQFRGHRIVQAVFEDLRTGGIVADLPRLTEADLVIFAGGSAGGEGQINQLDRQARLLPGVRVLGITDSYYHPQVAPFPCPPVPRDPATAGSVAVDFWRAQVDESCAMANPGNLAPCLTGTFVYPYLETPDFIFEDQLDENRLRAFGAIPEVNINPPVNCGMFTPEQRAWLLPYATVVRNTLMDLRYGGAFSTAVGYHTALTDNNRFFEVRVDGLTYATVLGNWVFNRPGRRVVVDPMPCR
jgi:hypothetical protein